MKIFGLLTGLPSVEPFVYGYGEISGYPNGRWSCRLNSGNFTETFKSDNPHFTVYAFNDYIAFFISILVGCNYSGNYG